MRPQQKPPETPMKSGAFLSNVLSDPYAPWLRHGGAGPACCTSEASQRVPEASAVAMPPMAYKIQSICTNVIIMLYSIILYHTA